MEQVTGLRTKARLQQSSRKFALQIRRERALRAHEFEKRHPFQKGTPTQSRGGSFLEQVTGIEPAYSAWEADTLPLSYTCLGALQL